MHLLPHGALYSSSASGISAAFILHRRLDSSSAEYVDEEVRADQCNNALTKLMTDGKATGHLAGVFYWEPEAPNGYNGGYRKGCFDGGKPTSALDAFK